MTQEDITLNEKELERLKHALGMDNKDAVHGIYEAYRRCSVYNEPIKEWDNLVRKGFATKSVDSDNQISYRVTEKGMKKVADATGLMIKYTLEFEPNPDIKNFTLTQKEEKKLLLKDLCAKLTNGVICSIYREDDEGFGWRDAECKGYFQTNYSYEFYFEDIIAVDNIENIKPYLRPISSMTEEERNEYFLLKHRDNDRYDNIILLDEASALIDWLNQHHFDYRGLIKKGLAFEAPEDMYKID